MTGGSIPFERGLHALGDGHYAYLQPTGTWGYSNAGLVVDGDQSLLVDTLFDERLTAGMLDEMRRVAGVGGGDVTTLVNTHANGDHTYGNRLVVNAEIIASAASAAEMLEAPPEQMVAILELAPQLGEVGDVGDRQSVAQPGVAHALPEVTVEGFDRCLGHG